MNKLIFWDWTGTLADEAKLDMAVCTSMEQEIAKHINISSEQAVTKYQDYLKKLENTWQWHDYVTHCQDFGIDWQYCQKINLKKLELVPYAGEILTFARQKGYQNILATNAVRKVIRLRVEHMGILDLFDMVIASDDVNALKAEGKHFKKGLSEFNGDALHSFSVGDNPIQDIRPAQKLQLKTIFCEYGKHLTHYHSEHISHNHGEFVQASFEIKNLKEIKHII